jgi:CheY-like chemotaxis protein
MVRDPRSGLPTEAETSHKAGDTTRPTAPPPDTRYSEEAQHRHLQSTVPPSGVSMLEEDFVMPERRFFDRLEERARRAELLTVMLQAQGLSPASGVRALQAALAAIVASAEETHLKSLASLTRALHAAIGELGIPTAQGTPTRTFDVLVLDETEVSRDLVALAVEAQGHMVRCAATYDDLVRHLDERLPDLLITDIELTNAPPRHFCQSLAELLAMRPIPVVFFSSVEASVMEELARKARARAAITKAKGVTALMTELEQVFHSL